VNEFSVLARVGLLLVRPGMLIAILPGLGGNFVPNQAKIALAALTALALLPAVTVPAEATEAGLAMVVGRELAIGLSLGFTVRALIAGAEFAGHLSGFQIGFSYSATIDPASGVRNSTVSALFGMLAVLTFFGVNGHHAVLRALVMSYEGLPIGLGGIDQSLLTSVREILSLLFVVAARLAAPIVIVLLVVEVVVGLIARTAPSLGFMVIGYPIRLAVGLFVLGLIVTALPGVVASFVTPAIEIGARVAAAFR
jgi:flagellar biosynthetic protein FliR